MWNSFRQRFHSALRFKMLALVLLPLSFAMVATLGYTLYWFHSYTEETLHAAIRNDLVLGRHALRQLQDEYQLELQQLAESAPFRGLLQRQSRPAVQRALRRVQEARGFAFLHVTGVTGNWLYDNTEGASKPSPLTDRAVRGFPGAALEVFRADELRRESAALVAQARILRTGPDSQVEHGLMLRLVQPILDEQGRVSMTLDAAVLLNQNRYVVETIRGRVFAADVLPPGAEPIVTLLLDDTRIAATGSDQLVGERLATELRKRIVDSNDLWIGSDALVGHDYIVAYGQLFDVNGQRVGMLQVGVREGAFRAGYYRTAGLLLLLFVTAGGIAAWIAVRGVRSVVRPIEAMAAVARATAAGKDRRIGPIGAKDEVGALAHQFDAMLDQLAVRNREIQRSAAALELKVTERTQELADRNNELHETIALLQKTREQLILAEKLSALGEMAAGIAHEINNPAAVILGNLDVIARELGAHATPVTHEIDLIAQQVERIRHIVTSLLQFARARPNEGPIMDISVNQLVDDVLPLVAHALKAKSIVLRCRLEAKGKIAINVFDLEQVLINLIANAAHACSNGGAIEVATSGTEEDGAVISVRDNGRGISPEHLKRLFDPFFTTDPKEGFGLGLSVSYGLVQRYGGHISVESTVDQGSVFRVWLLRQPKITPAATLAKQGRTATQNEEVQYG
jgi:two-component system NtrC family sensor kinase